MVFKESEINKWRVIVDLACQIMARWMLPRQRSQGRIRLLDLNHRRAVQRRISLSGNHEQRLMVAAWADGRTINYRRCPFYVLRLYLVSQAAKYSVPSAVCTNAREGKATRGNDLKDGQWAWDRKVSSRTVRLHRTITSSNL